MMANACLRIAAPGLNSHTSVLGGSLRVSSAKREFAVSLPADLRIATAERISSGLKGSSGWGDRAACVAPQEASISQAGIRQQPERKPANRVGIALISV